MNWMSNYSNISLKDLIIPGSHDSFANYFKSYSHNDLNLPIIFNPIIKRWAKTQNKTITEQLNLGIRYFDIRVEEYKNVFYCVHSLLSHTLYDVLNEILLFIKNNPTEKILIDINHIYNITDINILKNYVKSIFEGYLVKNNIKNLNKPIKKVKGNILLFLDVNDEFIFLNDNINSMWHNTNNINTLINSVENEKLDNKKINISQMILTIQLSNIFKSFLCCCNPTSLENLNDIYKNDMLNSLRNIITEKNIIIMDFVDEEFINICINANQKYT